MSFKYLDGLRWSEVTRDERFFCQHLYQLVNSNSVSDFADFLSEKLALNLLPSSVWELGYEICFYRDLWQLQGKSYPLFSPKRTFDLCLFGESSIVIIEAKAAGGFESGQNDEFRLDVGEVKKLTGLEQVELVALCSSSCELDDNGRATFGDRVITWKELAGRYGNDSILRRADEVYEGPSAFSAYGANSDGKHTGTELLQLAQSGASLWVGRGGGCGGQ